MKEQHRGPVIVVAPGDAVVVFESADALVRDLERMDFGAGDRSRYFDLEGAELALVQERGVTMILRDRRRGEPAEEPTLDEQDAEALRTAADRALSIVWAQRFPRRPRWLHRLLHGESPLNV